MANIRKATGHTANPWEASIADFFNNKNWERQLGGIDPRSGEPTLVGNWYRPAGSVGSEGDIQNNVKLRKGPFPYEPLTVPRVEVEPAVEVGNATPSLPGMNEFEGYKAATADPVPTEKEGMIGQFVDVASDVGGKVVDVASDVGTSVGDAAHKFGFDHGQTLVDAFVKANKKAEELASRGATAITKKAAGGAIQDGLKQYNEGFRDAQNFIEKLAAGGGLNPVIDVFNQFQRGTHRRSSEMSRAVHDWAAGGGVQRLGNTSKATFMDILKFLRKGGMF